MRSIQLLTGVAALALTLAAPAAANDKQIAAIIDEGMNRSEVMLTSHEMMDRIGQRLTNSPNMRRAEAWAIGKFTDYGLSNVRREAFDFGRGWEMIDIEVDMLAPRPLELTAISVAWTPGTNGAIEAPIVVAPMADEGDFDAYRGKLAGKIVLVSLPGTGDEPTKPAFSRYTDKDIGEFDEYQQPSFDPDAPNRRAKRTQWAQKLDSFLAEEGAIAWVSKSYRDGKLLHGSGYRHRVGDTPKVAGIEMAAEDYRRLARLAKTGDAPVLRINSQVRWDDSDTNAYNILADIPGSDPKAGYVMAGAHFDSWAAGDGAVDNGAGSAVVLEAARILKKLGVKPKRTIRFALWAGEEQGLLGSKGYIESHLAHRSIPEGLETFDAYLRWPNAYPIQKLSDYDALKVYFNMDNGSGKFRGIYAEGNFAAKSLLGKWLSPFSMMDAGRVVMNPTGGTDHQFMQAVGIPAFQFIQDPLDYSARLHHTNIDTLDHMRPEDLRQAAVVMAGMLLQAANSDEELPRPPLPTQPSATDPFKYDYPDE